MLGRTGQAAMLGLMAFALAFSAQAQGMLARYVVLGDDGQRIVRAITSEAVCPTLTTDGAALPMSVRAGPATAPLRKTLSGPDLSKPSEFPVLTCEAIAPMSARRLTLDGAALPLPPKRIDRIVVIGDTGCRLKASDGQAQDCNDPAAYPFAKIAKLAADWRPELVIHVGDYHYRETACPTDRPGCAGSPWGYGWDAWNADLFTPGAPLLAAAPWVVVRGNHENCVRAGQGWFRFLDPHPLTPGRDCNDETADPQNDYTAPYAAPLGDGAQVIVLDLASVGEGQVAPDSPLGEKIRRAHQDMTALSAKGRYTFVANHKPILGFGASLNKTSGGVVMRPGNRGPQAIFAAEDPNLFPSTVHALLSGHIHLWQQVSFSTPQPTQFISGFSGTLEDTPPIPDTLPEGSAPAPGTVVDHFSSWTGQFGFMTMERRAVDRWSVIVHDLTGAEVRRCEIVGRTSTC